MDTLVMKRLRLALTLSPKEEPVLIAYYLRSVIDWPIYPEATPNLPWAISLQRWAVVKQTLLVHIVRNKNSL